MTDHKQPTLAEIRDRLNHSTAIINAHLQAAKPTEYKHPATTTEQDGKLSEDTISTQGRKTTATKLLEDSIKYMQSLQPEDQ